MSPRATCATRTGTAEGWSSASPPFLQAARRTAPASRLQIRTDGLLQVGERLLGLEDCVQRAAARGGQIVLCLEDRDQRSPPDAIPGARHLEDAPRRLEELAAVEAGAAG